MSIAMGIIGVITIIAGIILGISTESFVGFIVSLLSSVVSSMIFFALSVIISNQESILSKLYSLDTVNKKLIDKTKCEKCGKEYDYDYSRCPFCNHKPE